MTGGIGAGLRVLHGPANVGNQPWVVSRHERELGARSDLVVNYGTWLQYPADRVISEYGRKSAKAQLARAAFAVRAPFRHDVLHYYFGRSFSCWDDYGTPNARWYLDAKAARRLGRTVVMTLQGCDVRISAASAERNRYTMCHEGNCGAVSVCRSELDRQRTELMARWLPLCDRTFVLNPELQRFVPGSTFMPYASVDLDAFERRPPTTSGPVRIVHAPSDEGVKGSRAIIEAVEDLRSDYDIEFELVKGLPYHEALQRYRDADLVIDQVLAGWYGGLAVEIMAMGKPVACYLRNEDFDGVVPPAMRADLPLFPVERDTLREDLARILDDRAGLVERGDASYRYVHRWHDPRRIARALIGIYRNPASSFDLGDA